MELSGSFVFCCRAKRLSSEEMGSGGSTKKQITPLPRRDARQIYNPPSGKYSSSIGNFNYGEKHQPARLQKPWTVTSAVLPCPVCCQCGPSMLTLTFGALAPEQRGGFRGGRGRGFGTRGNRSRGRIYWDRRVHIADWTASHQDLCFPGRTMSQEFSYFFFPINVSVPTQWF